MENNDVKVRVEHLTKKFGDLLVLDDISFDIKKGEFVCIVGPTGCGKSAFLNLLTRDTARRRTGRPEKAQHFLRLSGAERL